MKPSVLIHKRIKRITLKIYLLYSLLLHATILLYLFSLPIYRGGIYLKPFGDIFVHIISEKGISSQKSPLEYKYKISKSNKGTLDKTKKPKIDLKENTKLSEEETAVVSETESMPSIKESLVEAVSQEAEVQKPLKPAEKIAFKEEALPKEEKEKDKETTKEKVYEAEDIRKKELNLQKYLPAEGPKEFMKPAETPAIPEKNKLAYFEPLPDKKIVSHEQESKEELMYVQSEKKAIVTEKNEQHETAIKEKEPPQKAIEVKKPKVSEIEKVSRKETTSGKVREGSAKAEKKYSKGSLKAEAKKTLSAISSKIAPKNVYDKKKTEGAISKVKETAIGKGAISQEKFVQGSMPSKKITTVQETPTPALPKADLHIPLEPVPDNKAIHSKSFRWPLAEIFTSEKNRTPLPEDYFLKQEESQKQTIVKINPEVKKEKEPPLGIPVSDVLFSKDIKIEVFFHSADISNILIHFLKKAHPMVNIKDEPEKPKEVDGVEEKIETYIEDTPRVKKSFSVSKAEKAVYIFVMENKGSTAYKADIVFRLLEGRAGERIKDIKTAELFPHATIKFKFILPEAIFWNDEYYFTGTIESSDTLTKFNEKTGLIWKEEKEY